jgi:hypothetical protein
MQHLAWDWSGKEVGPGECRRCGGNHFHRHGFYERWVLWLLAWEPERVKVARYLCVGCARTTSVLPWGILAYRLLALGILRQSLYDDQEERWRDLLRAYRRRWERWYPQLWRGIGPLWGKLPRDSCGGWEVLGLTEVNPKLVDQSGWSLFGRYRIHAPARVW